MILQMKFQLLIYFDYHNHSRIFYFRKLSTWNEQVQIYDFEFLKCFWLNLPVLRYPMAFLFRIIQRKPEKLSFRLAAVSGKQKSFLFMSLQSAGSKKESFQVAAVCGRQKSSLFRLPQLAAG